MSTKEKLKLDFIPTKIEMDLIDMLNTRTNPADGDVPGSIMEFGNFCKCDSGWLCEHRLKHIINFVRTNFIRVDIGLEGKL